LHIRTFLNKRFVSPFAFYPLLRLPPSSSPSQPHLHRRYGRDSRGGSARRRPRGHGPVRLPRCCPLLPLREWVSTVTERSRPSTPLPCVFLDAPWKRSVLRRPGGGSLTHAQGPSWRTPATPAMERQSFFPQREGISGPRALRWARTPQVTTREEEWCW
jgi:hypothetical protein